MLVPATPEKEGDYVKAFFTLALVAILLAAAGTAFGYPSLLGPTGLALTPTADIGRFGSLQIAATFYNTKDDIAGLDNTEMARAAFVVLPEIEVGAAFWRAKPAGGNTDTMSANAKIKLPLSLIGGNTAVGAILARTNGPVGPDETTTCAYIANTRGLLGIPGGAQTFRLTLGANWTRIEDGTSVDGIRGFAGLEFDIMDGFTVAAEYQMKKSDLGDTDPLTSVVGRLAISENLVLEAGVTNADPVTGGFTAMSEHNLFAGVILDWGGK